MWSGEESDIVRPDRTHEGLAAMFEVRATNILPGPLSDDATEFVQ